MKSIAACTIVGANYLPLARVLSRSYLQHHPGHSFVIVDIDEYFRDVGETGDSLECRGIDWLINVVPEFALMATIYDVTEFATSLKPFVLRALLEEFEVVTYLDPDIRVYAPLDELIRCTDEHGWSLTPHCLQPMVRDEFGPREADIMMSGIYNLGYIGTSRKAEEMLDWWSERLRRDSISDPANQLFTDQRWIDLAVPIFRPHIEPSPAYNVAYWNLDQRPLRLDGDTVMVDGEPLRFFHFSGFDVDAPWWLSKHAGVRPRNLMSAGSVLGDLCTQYAAEVKAARMEFGDAMRYKWSEALPGLQLSLPLRRLVRRELIESDRGRGPVPPSPFMGGSSEFRSWLSERPGSGGLPRYAQAILDSRDDLRDRFGGEVASGSDVGLLRWIDSIGIGDHPWLTLIDRSDWTREDTQEVVKTPATLDPLGIDIVGYLRSEHGVGEAGRLAADAMRAVGVDVALISSTRTITRQGIDVQEDSGLRHRVKLLAVNADQTKIVRSDLGERSLDSSYVIGQWFWEIESFPEQFLDAFEVVDEVWAATEFVANAIRAVAPSSVPVNVMPLPLVAPEVKPGFDRSSLGLDDRYLFLFSFDFLSVVERKNPMGLIRAYRDAFHENDGAQLVVKSVNGERNLRALEQLRWMARDRDDITVIDGYLDRGVVAGLMADADCYVSLHRSEGLGLTMSESMALGVPVIATGYSGNVDFMNDQISVLVPWSYRKVGNGAEPYDANSLWAEPNLVAAGEAMRRVFENPEEGKRIGAAARAYLETNYATRNCGQRMLERLQTINEEMKNA